MSSEPPTPSSDIRSTFMFRHLRSGREKKLGRELSEAELLALEPLAAGASAAGVKPASAPRELSSMAIASAVRDLPKKVVAVTQPQPKDQTWRAQADEGEWVEFSPDRVRRGRRAIGNVAKLVERAVAAGKFGKPELPPYARKTAAIYVQQEDLDAFVPDGWGHLWGADETRELRRRHQLPGLAIPLLALLELTGGFRPPALSDSKACGAGFQVTLPWLARKLGCTLEYVLKLINILDPYAKWRRAAHLVKVENKRRRRVGEALLPYPEKPTGVTVYIHRFRRLRRWENLHPDGAVRRVWLDAKKNPHQFVDVRGVCYLTNSGRAVVTRSEAGGDASADMHRRARRTRWFVSGRLRRGHELGAGNTTEILENRQQLRRPNGVRKKFSPNNRFTFSHPPSRHS